MIVWQRGGVCLAITNKAASYNLAAEDMTNLMIWERVSNDLLLAGMVTSSEKKMCFPARMQDLLSLQRIMSEFSVRTMLLER